MRETRKGVRGFAGRRERKKELKERKTRECGCRAAPSGTSVCLRTTPSEPPVSSLDLALALYPFSSSVRLSFSLHIGSHPLATSIYAPYSGPLLPLLDLSFFNPYRPFLISLLCRHRLDYVDLGEANVLHSSTVLKAQVHKYLTFPSEIPRFFSRFINTRVATRGSSFHCCDLHIFCL